MSTSTNSLKRTALFAGAAAIFAMVIVAIGDTSAVASTHAPAPAAAQDSKGDLNYSASFAPSKPYTAPWTPIPGSPWRD